MVVPVEQHMVVLPLEQGDLEVGLFQYHDDLTFVDLVLLNEVDHL